MPYPDDEFSHRKPSDFDEFDAFNDSKGGDDGITNIQPLCKICNCRKHNRVEQLL